MAALTHDVTGGASYSVGHSCGSALVAVPLHLQMASREAWCQLSAFGSLNIKLNIGLGDLGSVLFTDILGWYKSYESASDVT